MLRAGAAKAGCSGLCPVYFTSSVRCLCTWIRSPWAFTSPGWNVPALSASHHVRCSSPLFIFVALHWIHFSMSIPFLYWMMGRFFPLHQADSWGKEVWQKKEYSCQKWHVLQSKDCYWLVAVLWQDCSYTKVLTVGDSV